jgi:ATP-binding cassette subfamily F protein 3
MNAIEALINALKNFTGGVLVVSHDQHFITSVCNEIWVIGNSKVQRFKGEFNDYKKKVIREVAKKKES